MRVDGRDKSVQDLRHMKTAAFSHVSVHTNAHANHGTGIKESWVVIFRKRKLNSHIVIIFCFSLKTNFETKL